MTRLLALTAAACLTAPAFAQNLPPAMSAEVQDRDGNFLGSVYVDPTPTDYRIVVIALTDLPEGVHAVHIHETGDCSADDFTSAGGHLAGDAQHGVLNQGGPHPGDLPNVTAHADGLVNVEYFTTRLSIDNLMDGDGAAFIVHSGPNDYETEPAGEAGNRIACGVFQEEAG